MGSKGAKSVETGTFLRLLNMSAALVFSAERWKVAQAKAILHRCCASMSNDKQQLVEI